MKLGISGHRYHKLGNMFPYVKRDIRERLEILASQDELDLTLNSGMALGVDLFAASVAAQLKVPFEAFIPFETYDSAWPKEYRQELQKLLAKAKKVHIVCETPSKKAFIQRNRALVEHSDQMLAYLLPSAEDSGTGHTVNIAKDMCKPIKIINPCDILV
jgi:uncharacterized phage-like protein YoqJ